MRDGRGAVSRDTDLLASASCRRVCVLNFSSGLLTETSQVTFLNAGDGPDDWFALIAFQEE